MEGKGGPQVTVEPGPLRALIRHCERRKFPVLCGKKVAVVLHFKDELELLAL